MNTKHALCQRLKVLCSSEKLDSDVYIVTTIIIFNCLMHYYSPKLVKKQSDAAEGFEVSA